MSKRVELIGYDVKAAVSLFVIWALLLLFSGPSHAGNAVLIQTGNPENTDSAEIEKAKRILEKAGLYPVTAKSPVSETDAPGTDISYEKSRGKGRVSVVKKDDTGGQQVKTIRLNMDKLKSDNWLLEQYSKTTGEPLPAAKQYTTPEGTGTLINMDGEDDGVYGEFTRKEPVKKKKRDPFMLSDLMKEKNMMSKNNKGLKNPLNSNEMLFMPTKLPDRMPKMSLRGHIKNNSDRVIALIDIEGGGIHMVREGDTIGLQDMGYDTFIRIKKIGRLHLVVESGKLGKLFIVR